MPDDFDPYYEWLGIPRKDQPPNHYRLLALDAFEENPNVISHAASRQMTYVRTFQNGEHAEDSQGLLNHISAAKLCLLRPETKAAYDSKLRSEMSVCVRDEPDLPAGDMRRTGRRAAFLVGFLILAALVAWGIVSNSERFLAAEGGGQSQSSGDETSVDGTDSGTPGDSSSRPEGVPPGAEHWNGNWYWFPDEELPIAEARQFAERHNARFLVISSDEETSFVFPRVRGKTFLGIHRNANGDWADAAGQPQEYLRWSFDEPSTDETGAIVVADESVEWFSMGESSTPQYVALEWGDE